jgi:spoIIIJ-associated protein
MDSEQSEASGLIVEFVIAVTTAMGLTLKADVTETGDLLRVNLSGEGAEWLVRRRGETLNALQHIVSTVFRDSVPEDQRVVVDCLGFRHDKDAEIRKMAQFMADKAVSSGTAQEMGPLNPYERRIVHMAVAERGDATSESIGDAFMKTVIISAK